MKKFLLLVLVLSIYANVNAQTFQFSTVTKNDTAVNSALRYSWRIPIRFKISELKNDQTWYGAFSFKNEGTIFDVANDRVVMRGIFAGLETGFVFYLNKLAIAPALGIDYQLHYKEKLFTDQKRSNKSIEDRQWFSDKLNPYNVYARLGLGKKDGLMLFAEVYFMNFVNPNYTETINGVKTKPLDGYQVNRFNLGLSYIFDGNSNKRNFKATKKADNEVKNL